MDAMRLVQEFERPDSLDCIIFNDFLSIKLVDSSFIVVPTFCFNINCNDILFSSLNNHQEKGASLSGNLKKNLILYLPICSAILINR